MINKLRSLLASLDDTRARVDAYQVAPGSLLKLSPPNNKTVHMLRWIKSVRRETIAKGEFKSVSLLSGVSCPGANLCKSQAVVGSNGRRHVQDGPACQFRCFSASDETNYNDTYSQREHNRKAVLACGNDPIAIAALLCASIAPSVKLVRAHIGGDYLSLAYLMGWILFAALRPNTRIYSYTKSLHFMIKLDCSAADLPGNMRIVMSAGGLFDCHLPALKALGFNSATVVFTKRSAAKLGLEIDHKDNLAAYGTADFALLIHAVQPKGTEAAAAVQALRKAGDNGYSEKQERI